MAKGTLKANSLMPSITANDIKQSIKFYVDGLGFSVRDEMKDANGAITGVILSTGNTAAGIGISQDDFSKGRDRVKGIGVRLWIETDQDIGEIAASVKAAGFKIDGEPAPLPWGPLAFGVTDPDGYKLTVTKPEK